MMPPFQQQALLRLLLPTFLLFSSRSSFRVLAQLDLSCDTSTDPCPTKYNNVCERDSNPLCADGDCYDCDECRQFEANCDSCIANGCFYCPGDASCLNSPNYVSNSIFSHCTSLDDYVTDTCEQPENFFSDPAYSGQAWVYEMVNVESVWNQGIFGQGVRVRINDNGVDSGNIEFQDRFDTANGCDQFEPTAEELQGGAAANHGTSVASILGAAGNNGECSVGIAPEVTLSSCYVFDGSDFWSPNLDSYDISQNSWGIDACEDRSRRDRQLQNGGCPFQFDPPNGDQSPCEVCDFGQDTPSFQCQEVIKSHCRNYYEIDEQGCIEFLDIILGGNCLYGVLSTWEREAIVKGITEGRGGKGIIYVFASGNANEKGDDTNFQSYTNTRFMMSVGAVGKDGSHASYSVPGASLFVTGPGGDFENESNHVTAGLGNSCQDIGSGTSFSTPVVSGIIALMLEVNPDLTWRDVQYILAETSQRVTDFEDNTNGENSVGLWHSNYYGFGIVDAAAAVGAASSWTLVGPELMVMAESEVLNLPIVDDESVVLSTSLALESAPDGFIMESVVVQLDVESFARGHLEIVLTSPQGTRSVLHPGDRPENTQRSAEDRWKLLTVRNWGESPEGEWTLEMVDTKEGDAGECQSLPWLNTIGRVEIDCNFLEKQAYCVDAEVDPSGVLSTPLINAIFGFEDEDGVFAEEACCACGGGISDAGVTDQLREWTLVVYGTTREVRQDETEAPSSLPSQEPSIVPSIAMVPSQVPSVDLGEGTAVPSSLPSQAPSSADLGEDTAAPSVFPSDGVNDQEPTVTITITTGVPTTGTLSPTSNLRPTRSPTTTTTRSPTTMLARLRARMRRFRIRNRADANTSSRKSTKKMKKNNSSSSSSSKSNKKGKKRRL